VKAFTSEYTAIELPGGEEFQVHVYV